MSTTTIIRIPDAENSEYDIFLAVPEGMTPDQAVAAINAGIDAIDADDAGEGRMGDAMDALLSKHGFEYVSIIDTIEW